MPIYSIACSLGSKMHFKVYIFCQFIAITNCLMGIVANSQQSNQPSSPKALAQMNNLHILDKNSNNLMAFVPRPRVNFTDLLSEDNSYTDSLFKLNTDVLFNKDLESDIANASPAAESRFIKTRQARKINFLRGLWNKPKVSPLYLINGTVCRFVNTTPICTTLTTSGLLPTGGLMSSPSTSGQTDGGNAVVQFPFNNNQPQQFSSNNQQSNQNNQQFLNNNQPRPSSILDDDSQDINVEGSNPISTEGSTSNSTSTPTTTTTTTQQQQQQQYQQTSRPMGSSSVVQGSSRPVNLASNRRPMNMLSLRRPVRQFHLNTGRTT